MPQTIQITPPTITGLRLRTPIYRSLPRTLEISVITTNPTLTNQTFTINGVSDNPIHGLIKIKNLRGSTTITLPPPKRTTVTATLTSPTLAPYQFTVTPASITLPTPIAIELIDFYIRRADITTTLSAPIYGTYEITPVPGDVIITLDRPIDLIRDNATIKWRLKNPSTKSLPELICWLLPPLIYRTVDDLDQRVNKINLRKIFDEQISIIQQSADELDRQYDVDPVRITRDLAQLAIKLNDVKAAINEFAIPVTTSSTVTYSPCYHVIRAPANVTHDPALREKEYRLVIATDYNINTPELTGVQILDRWKLDPLATSDDSVQATAVDVLLFRGGGGVESVIVRRQDNINPLSNGTGDVQIEY